MSEPVRLDPRDLAALADLIAERLAGRLTAPLATEPALVDAAMVARALGVSRDTVYVNAARLGARRLGDGPRPRLRFVLAEAVAAWTSCPESERSEFAEQPVVAAPSPRRRASRSGTALDALPVRELQPRPLRTKRPRATGIAGGSAQGAVTP